MKENKQLKAGVVLSYGNVILHNVISIVYTPVMLRILGQSEYGLYQLVYSVVSYLGLLNFGFGSTYVRFHSRHVVENDEEGIARLNGMFMSIFLVLGAIALLAGGVLVFNVENIFRDSLSSSELGTAQVLMALMVLNLAISFPISVFDSYITAHEQYFFQRMITLSQTVLNPFLTLPLLLLGYKSISLVVITTILTFGKLIMNLWFCLKKKKMKFIFHGFRFRDLKEIWVFSFYIFINMIVDQINWSVDKFLIGKIMGTVAVAVYSIGGQMNTYFMNFSTSISSVFIPRVNRLVSAGGNDKELTKLFTRVGRIQFLVLSFILSGFIFFGQFFINGWAGEGYKDAYMISLILIVPVIMPLIQNTGIEIQRAKNLHKFRSVIYLLIAIANIVISIPLIYRFGEIGAAMGTAFSLIVGNVIIMNIYYQKRVGLDMFYFWKQILKILPGMILPILVGIGYRLFAGELTIVSFILGIGIYAVVFIISMWFLGMNEDEKNLVSGMVPFLRRRDG